jgi:hypothetical protein
MRQGVGALVLGAVINAAGGFGRVFGGMIGKPEHEIVIEPEEEPVPKTQPAPVLEPVPEPVPARSRRHGRSLGGAEINV